MSSSVIAASALIGYVQTVLSDNPLAYYRLGEASGTIVNDSSGNSRNGTVDSTVGLGSTGLITNDSNTAWLLNAYEGGQVALASWMQPTVISFTSWVRLTSYPSNQGVIAGRGNLGASDSSAKAWYFYIGPTGAITITIFVNGTTTKTGVTAPVGTIQLNTTYHAAFTFDNTTIRLYLNGVEVMNSPRTGTLSPGSRPLTIGRSEDSLYVNNATILDEIALFNTVLSPTRIAAHYAAGIGTL